MSDPLDVGMVKAPWGSSRFLEGFGVGLFAEFLKAADKREKGKGADNLRKGRALLERWVKKRQNQLIFRSRSTASP